MKEKEGYIMKTIDDFLKEKVFITEDSYAYFTSEGDKIFLNYGENGMKLQYNMLFDSQYYKELLLGARQLINYYLMKESYTAQMYNFSSSAKQECKEVIKEK